MALMSDQLKAALNRCVFTSALRLARDEADWTLLGRVPDFFSGLLYQRAGLHNTLLFDSLQSLVLSGISRIYG